MVLEYISKPSSLILGVTPANSDIANSDALKIAQQVDPDGQRTIGVLTKLDLMDRGTDCLEVLQGRVYPLRHGFIATVNRSQQDIVQNLSVEEARKQEQKFFAEHPIYKQVASHCGVNYLSNALNKLLMGHIRDCLPELRSKVNTSLTTLRSEILALGDEKISTNKGALLLNLINSFVHVYICTIDGRLATKSSTEELYGGARINYIFNDIYSNYIDQIHALGGLTEDEIQIVMTNATGPKASLFIPEESFEQLSKCQIKILEDPSLRCADLVYDELQRIINCIEIPELKRFSNLRDKITEVANDLLRNCKKPAQDMIKSLIAVELSHINTNHPDFMRGGEAIAEILKQRAERQQAPPDPNQMPDASPELKQQLEQQRRLHEQKQREEQIRREREELRRQAQEREERERREREHSNKKGFFGGLFHHNHNAAAGPKKEGTEEITLRIPPTVVPKKSTNRNDETAFQTELIELLLSSYFKIVRKNIKDRVPKTIMFFMVNASKEKIQNELVKSLYKEDLFSTLLEESDDIAQRREQLRETIEVLSAAQRILNEIINYKFT